jgi:Leucine-rich repeat (LRR) protein
MKKRQFILLFLLLFVIFSQNSKAGVIETDSLALVALFDSTVGKIWTNRTNWLSSEPVSDWYGVTVKGDRVIEISLKNNNLVGTIPTEIANITALMYLNLGNNQLGDSIPEEIGNLTSLKKLYLGHNQFIGIIPNNFCNLRSLTHLGLNNNQLNGSIPTEIGDLQNLYVLGLSSNQLSGPIPSSIGKLEKLSQIYIMNNQLSGSLPVEIGGLASLTYLSAANNQFSGSLPSEIGNLTSLKYLGLDHNQFSGEIPTDIGKLENLEYIYLDSNQFSGSIPAEICNLTNLTFVYMCSNNFSGEIPFQIGRLKKIKHLFLCDNNFSGAIPDSLIHLGNLERLLIYNNMFDGLPDLSSLTKIKNLYLENNMLTFEDLEANIGITGLTYSPQDSVGESQDTLLTTGSSFEMSVTVGGTANQYQWMKDNVDISGATDSVYNISSVILSDAGSYVCKISNSIAIDLTLYSRPLTVHTEVATGINNTSSILPKKYALQQNYPNPFNPTTKIDFAIPQESKVTIKIYNVSGQQVVTLLDAQKPAGYHSVIFKADNFSAGIYFYEIKAESFHEIKKMILLK